MAQDDTPVTHKSVNAKISGRKWEIRHTRAKETYADKRGPKVEVEKNWPCSVRTLYSRLRTGHAKELAYYRYKIDKDNDPFCRPFEGEHESIKHILFTCPVLRNGGTRNGQDSSRVPQSNYRTSSRNRRSAESSCPSDLNIWQTKTQFGAPKPDTEWPQMPVALGRLPANVQQMAI